MSTGTADSGTVVAPSRKVRLNRRMLPDPYETAIDARLDELHELQPLRESLDRQLALEHEDEGLPDQD